MKKTICILVVLFWAFFAFGQSVVLYNANIVDVENGKIIEGQTVTVKDGVIQKIKKAKRHIAKGQMDLTGTFLMPGLIDSHVHWGNFGYTPEYMQKLSDAYLAEGITTVRDVGGDMRPVKTYTADLDSGRIAGPTVYMSSFWAGPEYFGLRENPDTKGWHSPNAPWSRTVRDTTTEVLEQWILEAKDYGCVGFKLYHDISAELLNKIVPLCEKHDMRPWAHFTIKPATSWDVVTSGVETVTHAYLAVGIDMEEMKKPDSVRYSPEEIAYRDTLFKEMVRRGTILDATVVVSQSYAPYAFRYTNEAYHAGVKIAAGTDYADMTKDGYKSVFLKELDWLADSCGMSIPDVLRAATTVGAEILRESGKLGIIREGAEADLLVLRKNPLESLAALKEQEALFIDGKRVK